MLFLKQSTSVTVHFGPFVDKTDGVTLETGLGTAMDNATTGIRLSKNGGTLADRTDSTAPAHDAMGFYKIVLDATDTGTLGTLMMVFEEAATTLPGWMTFMIVPANVWDSLFGADTLQVDVTEVGGSAEDLPTATALAAAQTDLDTLTDASGEPGIGAPAVSLSMKDKISWLYKTLRNRKNSTATLIQIYNDDATTVDHKKITSDDGTTYEEGEMITGA